MFFVTGAAGFIGFHLARRLLSEGHAVHGIDNLSPYYDVTLKQARLSLLRRHDGFTFHFADVADRTSLELLFESHRPSHVVHLAAQAGVRYSLTHPEAYVQTNIVGFFNVIDCCRKFRVQHLVYASSSSVYGLNGTVPFSEHNGVDHPLNIYAASKRTNELIAHSYSHLYQIPTTGLRFFNAYGPWGRPDMALSLFTKAILEGRPINVFNESGTKRDFTYIDDIVESATRVIALSPTATPDWNTSTPDPATSLAPFRIYNIGNSSPVGLKRFLDVLEQCLGRTAVKSHLPLQPGDLPISYADVSDLSAAIGFRPATPVEIGIRRFVDWYRWYYSSSPASPAPAEIMQ